MKNKILGILVMFLVLATPALATDTCLNDTLQNHVIDLYIEDRGTPETLLVDKNITCVNGCSYTMGQCRVNAGNEVLFIIGIVGGLIVLLGIAGYVFGWNTSGIYVIGSLEILFTLLLIATDVFTPTYRLVFTAYLLALAGIMIATALGKFETGREEED